jgi:uncharacterized membrane protein YgcG
MVCLIAVPLAAQDRVVDRTGRLSGSDRAELESRIAAVRDQYDFDLVIVFDGDIGGADLDGLAMDFYEKGGYGAGPDQDGAIFYNTDFGERRELSILATGSRGRSILNGAAWDKAMTDAAGALKKGNLKGAVEKYLGDWETFLKLDARGGRRWNALRGAAWPVTGVGWLVALLIAWITVQAWKAGMNTVISPGQASVYITPGSLAIRERKDQFLYSVENKTKRETEKSGGGSGGSGYSSSRTSSSGRSYSGGSRSY